jgi:predicted HTH domain antitoxin
MQHAITIECPPELLLGLHMNAEGFAHYLKQQAAISLFKEGKISSGSAATWLGIGRVAFLHLAFDAGATLLDDTADDLARETALL